MSEQTQGSEYVEWAVMTEDRPHWPLSTWKTRDEAEAYCAAREVTRERREREYEREYGRKCAAWLESFPHYVASRRVTDWQRVEEETT